MRARARGAAAVLAAAALAGSCGWRAGVAAPAGTRTIGVGMPGVADDVLEPDLAPLLHDALSRSLVDLSDVPLVPPDRADAVVEARIVEYRRRSGIRSSDQVLLETAVRIAVEATLVDRRNGAVLARAAARLPSGYATAVRDETADRGFLSGSLSAEAEARDRALTWLAERVVLDLLRPED